MHRKKVFFIGIVLVIVMTIVGSAASQPVEFMDSPAPALKLKVGAFVPSQETLPMAESLQIDGFGPGQTGYYIVQFSGPIQESWKTQIEAAGGVIVEYLPDYAFKIRLNASQLQQVNKIGSVLWTGVFQPAYKISPNLTRSGIQLYKLRVETGASTDAARSAIAAVGTQIIRQDGNFLVVTADQSQINALANITDVAWIENFVLYEKHNEYGAGVILGANTANANGYDGSSQIVAVADTGLGDGTSASNAGIPASRVTVQDFPTVSASGCYNAINDGARDVDSGHGTHTAVSVVGGGISGVGKGTAPAANLIFQAVEDYVIMFGDCAAQNADGYYLLGIPDDLTNLYQPAYDAGARIHSNSWGSNAAGEYTSDSVTTDTFMWNNRDMLITFSAGNAGTDANSDGVVDNDSIGSPATAKNVLTVGASENDRQGNWDCDTGLSYTTCASQGGQNDIFTYGSVWSSDFPANPLASDPSAGNANQMAAFSSRGPTDDGRIKPDIVAPGTWILSGYSDLYQQGYDFSANPQNGAWQYDGYGFPFSSGLKYMSGTSMSNPIAAGAATVVRDFYQKAYNHAASAALVKATLINTAVDLLDENNDGVNDNDFPIPNNHEGWGLINLAAATNGSQQYVDNTAGIGTGGSANYQYSIASGGSSFKVSLVWTDYPSTAAAAANLVNNLNLVVTAPDGTTTYRGNVFSGGWSQTGGSADSVNNVENVYVQSAAAGTWTVTVSGENVPQGPQPFAIVVSGQFGSAGNTAPMISGLPDQTVAVGDSKNNAIDLWSYASDTEDADLDLTFTITNSPVISAGVTIDSNRYIDINPAAGWSGSTNVTIQVEDSGGLSNADTFQVTVTNNIYVYLPAIMKPTSGPTSGPTPGFWESSTGDEFYVTPDRAFVDDFAIYISVTECGDYKITHIVQEPITNGQFSFSGAFYASGSFNSATAASGTDGLVNFNIFGCGLISGGPWTWNAAWQDSSQPVFLPATLIGPETAVPTTQSGKTTTVTPLD